MSSTDLLQELEDRESKDVKAQKMLTLNRGKSYQINALFYEHLARITDVRLTSVG